MPSSVGLGASGPAQWLPGPRKFFVEAWRLGFPSAPVVGGGSPHTSADITNFRAESTNFDNVNLRWSYSGLLDLSIYRAPHGGAYTLLATIDSEIAATFYSDSTVAESTWYDYKLSDDGGLSFSNIVSVKTQKQFPRVDLGAINNPGRISLPVFTSAEDVTVQNLQQLSETMQEFLNGDALAALRTCEVCSVSGALVLDCASGCYTFNVTLTEDINSISVNCTTAVINFIGEDVDVCGWSETSGSTGDECFEDPGGGGGSGPMTFTVDQDDPCQGYRKRYPKNGCLDYIEDCYDTGSYRIV